MHLMIALQLYIIFLTAILPLASARNIKASHSIRANQSEILVIMASGVNVTSIYKNFSEFKRILGVQLPDDRRVSFKTDVGKSGNVLLRF